MPCPALRPRAHASRTALSAGAALVAAGLTLGGCGGSDSDSAGGSATLVVQVQANEIPAFKVVAQEFEKQHAGVKIDLQTLTDEQKITTNGQILASNKAPAVAIVPTNAQSYTDLIRAKALVPLTDLWKKADLEKRYGTSVADSLKSNGTPYVVLFDKVLYNTVFYNKAAFTAAGLTPPADHVVASNADLFAMTKALKAHGYDGVAIGGNAGYKWGWLLDAQLFADAPKAALEDFTTSWQRGHTQKVKYTDPTFTGSIAQLKQWYDNGVFPPGALGQSDDQAQARFTSGKAAMLLGGSFSPAVLDKQKLSFSYDWLLLPSATPGKPTIPTAYAGDTFAISKQAKNQDLAKAFVELFVSDAMQVAEAKATASLPAVSSVDPAKIPSLGTQVQSMLAYTKQHSSGVGWTSVLPGGLGQSYVDPQIQKLLGGQATLAQVGQNQQKQFESFRAKNG